MKYKVTLEQFYKEISTLTALRENRLFYANMVLKDTSLFPKLLDILFMIDDKVSCKAAWIFEFICREHINTIVPYLDRFLINLKSIHLDSAVRPVAKVCELITTSYYSKTPNKPLQLILSKNHKALIVEACFDWMISSQKVAPKAYAMQTLFLLGQDIDWIHDELLIILEQNFYKESAAFKARAKRILLEIKKASNNLQ